MTGMQDVSSNNEACRNYLQATWAISGLKTMTIRHRLAAFAATGGAGATPSDIRAFLSRVPSASTRRSRLSDLRCCYRTLMLAGLIPADPTLAVPRVKATRWQPRPLLENEIHALYQGLPDRQREWLVLALYAGLRASEIATLCGEQLEQWPDGWALRVMGKGDVEATIPAHPRIVSIMRGKRGRLYAGATPNSITHSMRYYFDSLGVKGGVHRARHTFATRALAAADGDLLAVRDLMRHASVSTTQIYTQLPGGRLFDVMKSIA